MTGLTNVVSGSLEVAGDDDWVAVALTANETYQFTVTGLTNFASLILYPPGSTGTNQGTVTLFSPGGTSQAATLTVTPTATGTYYLDISDPGYSGSVETYTVTALNLGAPPAHLGDTPGTAGHLTIGGSLTSTLEYGTEHDWIAVALTANQTYEFTISGLDDQAVLMTYAPGSTGPVASANPTNVTVYPGNAQTNYLTLTPTTSGTYYIDISDPTAALSTETYTISGATVTDDFTNNPTHPAQLAVGGTPTYANLEVAGDHDWFAVNLTANQAYEFTEHGLTNYAVLTMYPPGSTGTNQATNAQAYSGGAQDSYLFFTPTTTGRYYLDVSDPGYATASTYYHVSVVTVAPDYTNNPSNAGLLTVGGSTTGTLSVLGEHDWIAVALTADQSYQFTVTGLSDLAVLQTFAPGSLGLNQGSPGISEYGGPQTNYLAFTPTQTGTYYLDISDPGNSGSPETYTVSAAAYSDDDTDNPTRPGHLTVGGSTTGVLETAGDHDWIAVTLTANQTYEFTVNGLTSFASLMTYAPGSTGINEATNAITIDPAYAQLQTAYLTFTPTETGTYYLDVSDAGYSGTPESYTLSVATAADDYTNNPSNPALLQVTVPTLAPAPADFTGDGLSNIVWQNTSGQIAVWTVSGTALSGSILPIATPAWTLQDTGDFNGDGK
ncbi:MAG TPA: hypothetical protein VMU59_09880, partial [Caulobacteraceae bacterium]|nr:hypothetical protein [Caulobacteraceae bacterium]